MSEKPFWERKSLNLLNQEEWESLCDGCARCCLMKLEDEESGEVYFTQVACRYLDLDSCRCTSYENRIEVVPDCIRLHKSNIRQIAYSLPPTCAYRLLSEGAPLPDWHPLICAHSESLIEAGISACSFAISETQLSGDEDIEDFIIDI